MGRRGVTVLVGAALVVLMVWGIMAAPVPYVMLGPGPTVDTLGQADGKQVIEVNGASTSNSAGQLRLVTVGVTEQIWLVDAIRGWLNDDDAVVPEEIIFPRGQSRQEVNEQNARDFKESQTSAETAALRKLGYPIKVTVTEVNTGAPAQGKLQAGDELTSVDGTAVDSAATLPDQIQAKPVGTTLTIGYTRNGQPGTTTIATTAGDGGVPRLGIVVENKQPHPFDLKIDLDKIGGPSAGLMFALGIIDKLNPTDLTGGKIIAGTGTIDDEGKVGPIGGIPQKLVGAKAAKATVFLTPADNCAEALGAPQPGLTLARVSTLDDALAALQAVREGRQPALCGAK